MAPFVKVLVVKHEMTLFHEILNVWNQNYIRIQSSGMYQIPVSLFQGI